MICNTPFPIDKPIGNTARSKSTLESKTERNKKSNSAYIEVIKKAVMHFTGFISLSPVVRFTAKKLKTDRAIYENKVMNAPSETPNFGTKDKEQTEAATATPTA
jgi:hypothetical protein